MADSIAPAKPRPRPKPRPKKAAPANIPYSQATDADGSGGTVIKQLGDEDDEDSMFMIHRTWKKTEEKPRPKSRAPSASSDVEIMDRNLETPKFSRPQKKKPRGNAPGWQGNKQMARLLSEDFSDHENESDELEIIDTPNAKAKPPKKRKRSRSRSITPPPAIPTARLQMAKNLVREALHVAPRAPSPTAGNDSLDTIVLDPELARIAAEMRSKPTLVRNQSSNGGGPETAVIRVRWNQHPNTDSRRVVTWGFKLKRHDTLKQLFTETASQAGIPLENLIISYDNNRLFTSATLHSLSVMNEAHFEACDKATYEYMRANRHEREVSHFDGHSEGAREPSRTSSLSPEMEDDAAVAEPESETTASDAFKLILRSGKTKDVSLNVRQSTTCKSIIQGFLKKAGLQSKYPLSGPQPKLQIDGDKMDPDAPISEAELEDGDMVEVVDL